MLPPNALRAMTPLAWRRNTTRCSLRPGHHTGEYNRHVSCVVDIG